MTLLRPEGQRLRIVVMGVSGCGKSTLARALADRLHLALVDGDDLHLPESIRKMSSGIALEDADRWPWLARIGEYLAASHDADARGRVVACSALKRAYRDRIRAHADGVLFVFLQGDARIIGQRMAARVGHYMQAGLLESQLRTLEVPTPDETDVLHLDIAQPVSALLARTLHALSLEVAATSSSDASNASSSAAT
jgi:carbohydrate kinase (thermoresistant glucokinase family)